MGTDIHGVAEIKNEQGEWVVWSRIPDTRNYRLFAALADVRNGVGFAFSYTHDTIETLTSDRGLPDDFAGDSDAYIGHSQGWVTLEEVFAWDGWNQTLRETGLLSKEQYLKWDRQTFPSECYRFLMGHPDAVVLDMEAAADAVPDGAYVRVYWSFPLRERCLEFLSWCEKLKNEVEEGACRIVFWFDS